ncbi:MAG: hypothetical protein J6X83_00055 [Methanomicrobium sp.]|nr:hypothetical protein [Methanomicrobium sp.]
MTIDRKFDALCDKCMNSERYTVVWACRLSNGFQLELYDKLNKETVSKIADSFDEIEQWVLQKGV